MQTLWSFRFVCDHKSARFKTLATAARIFSFSCFYINYPYIEMEEQQSKINKSQWKYLSIKNTKQRQTLSRTHTHTHNTWKKYQIYKEKHSTSAIDTWSLNIRIIKKKSNTEIFACIIWSSDFQITVLVTATNNRKTKYNNSLFLARTQDDTRNKSKKSGKLIARSLYCFKFKKLRLHLFLDSNTVHCQ